MCCDCSCNLCVRLRADGLRKPSLQLAVLMSFLDVGEAGRG